jgi:phospholipid/cholesterol/gamma-HCH transport system substrate-binding protein
MAISTEAKVGLLVVAAAAGLGWLSVQSGAIGSSITQSFRNLETEFSTVDGINIGSKVKMAGVQVGEVIDIELTPTGSAIIRISVDKDVPLANNVRAQIASTGLIGERFIALITEGTVDGALPKTAVRIPSAGTVSPEDIANNFAKVSDDLQEITASLRHAVGGPENSRKLAQIVTSFEGFSTRLDHLLGDEIQPGQIGKIVDNLATFSDSLGADGGDILTDMKASMESLRTILGSNEGQAAEMVKNINTTASNLAEITERLKNGEGALGRMLAEDGGMLNNFESASGDIKEIAQKINSGEGTLGKLVNDPQTVEKIEKALDSIGGITQRIESFRTEVAFEGYHLPAEEVGKGHFTLTLAPRPNRYYVLGVTGDGFASEEERFKDSGDANPSFNNEEFGGTVKFTAQFGHVYENAFLGKDLGLRVGVKDSTFGIGVDMKRIETPFWGHFVDISADLYDFGAEYTGRSSSENPHLDVTARVNIIDKSFYGIVGYDNVLNQKYASPFVGVGWKFQDDDLKYLVGSAL